MCVAVVTTVKVKTACAPLEYVNEVKVGVPFNVFAKIEFELYWLLFVF